MNRKKWIWQHRNFPNFSYDYTKIEPIIFKLIEKSGELKGKMSYLAVNEHDNFSVETSLSKPRGQTPYRENLNNSSYFNPSKHFNLG